MTPELRDRPIAAAAAPVPASSGAIAKVNGRVIGSKRPCGCPGAFGFGDRKKLLNKCFHCSEPVD
jgi:hypothetical protein